MAAQVELQGMEGFKKPNESLVRQEPSLMAIIERAVDNPNLDVDKLRALLEMKERWDKTEAKKAYVAALQAFKANVPEITKNKHVKAGSMEYDHATLDYATSEIGAALAKHGMSHTWKTSSESGKIRVTCVLTHELGHSEEEASLESAPDNSGGKNSIQAIGSAVTYLQRYTLFAACGIAPKSAVLDNDGQTSEGLSESAGMDYLASIRDSSTTEELQKNFAKAYEAASKISDKRSQELFIQAKNERYRQIKGTVQK